MPPMNAVISKTQDDQYHTTLRVRGKVLSSACNGDKIYFTVLSNTGLPLIISMYSMNPGAQIPYPGDHVEIEGVAVSGTIEMEVMSIGATGPTSSAPVASPRLLVVATDEPVAESAGSIVLDVTLPLAPKPHPEPDHAQDAEHAKNAAMTPALGALFFPAEASKATPPPEERVNRSMRPAEAWFGPMNERGPFPLYPTALDLEIPI